MGNENQCWTLILRQEMTTPMFHVFEERGSGEAILLGRTNKRHLQMMGCISKRELQLERQRYAI